MLPDKKYNGLEIAIIGMSGQFPGTENCRDLWKNLIAGKELITTLTDEELIKNGVPENVVSNKQYVKLIGMALNKDCFDAGFFGYTNEEASLMDPQTRLFHEHCWKALEDAGCTSLIESNKIGLFAGAATNDNWKMYVHTGAANESVDPFYLNMISSQRFISSLVSYKLNLRGPSVYVDTACSTSLVAVHLACRSLLTRECTIAMAGGAGIRSTKATGYIYQEGMVNSKDGHNKTFDSDASGTGAGEGVGVVVLKRLADALLDRDHIYAVIKASSVNNDGSNKVGYTAPGVSGQVECIKTAQKLAGIHPSDITYIEAHGTATRLGDPVEIRALNEAFGTGGKEKYCAIGSVKSNMGHLDAAAGVAGLIKTALCLQHKQLPASLHFNKPNPEVDFNGGPFYVNTELKEWSRKSALPLRAGLNSLGIGGTNAHVILEEAPEFTEEKPAHEFNLLTVSAKTVKAAQRNIVNLKKYLLEEPEVNMADMSYTLAACRKHFVHRASIMYRTIEELTILLDPEKLKEHIIRSKENRKVVFMFSGAGSQFVNMGRDLYEKNKSFGAKLDKGFAKLMELTGRNYKEIFYPQTASYPDINDMLHTQPAIFIFEYALASLIMEYGIIPDCMIGHSLGEYVAACISGVFSYDDALKLVVKRGELMNKLSTGAMVSVNLREEEAVVFLNDSISLAAVNGAEQVVFSGDIPAINKLTELLQSRDIFVARLYSSHAGHSFMIDPILNEYKTVLESVVFNIPQIKFISGVTGKFILDEQCCSVDYWLHHMRDTVRFADGIEKILSAYEQPLFIETGVGNSLTGLLKQRRKNKQEFIAVNLVRHPKENENDLKYLTERLGHLWAHGASIDWKAYYRDEKRRKISLPTYSFEQSGFPAEVEPIFNGFIKTRDMENRNHIHHTHIYFPSWKRSRLIPSKAGTGKRCCLVFSPEIAFAQSCKESLAQYGFEVIIVQCGEKYNKISGNHFVADVNDAAGFKKIFYELQHTAALITDIVYAPATENFTGDIFTPENNPETGLSYFVLVRIVQAMMQNHALKNTCISVITTAIHCVLGNEKINADHALLLGLVKCIPLETTYACRNIDIDNWDHIKNKMDIIAAEINHLDKYPDFVSLRNGQRWLQDYQEIPPVISAPDNNVIKKEGVYLIINGLSKPGFILAKYLAGKYDPKIILTGNSDIVEGEENPAMPGQLLNRWKHLEAISNKIIYVKTVSSKQDDINNAIGKAGMSPAGINGVIYIANETDINSFELIEDIPAAQISNGLPQSVEDINNIYQLFKPNKPDFVWITTRISSLLGAPGNVSLSASNYFINSFISGHPSVLPRWKHLVLDELLFADLDNGLSGNTTLLLSSETLELVSLFEWGLAENSGNSLLCSVNDICQRISMTEQFKNEIAQPDVVNEDLITKLERPDLSTSYSAPETESEEKLKQLFEHFFGIDNIGVLDSFFELGGDSLKGMMMLKRINRQFNAGLVVKDFFLDATVRGIAGRIDGSTWNNPQMEMENEITI